MFEKNAGLQALIQYAGKVTSLCVLIEPHQFRSEYLLLAIVDVNTAVTAKDALEGHCIYEGGFCKLHLSYSRHTDLSVKVDKSFK